MFSLQIYEVNWFRKEDFPVSPVNEPKKLVEDNLIPYYDNVRAIQLFSPFAPMLNSTPTFTKRRLSAV